MMGANQQYENDLRLFVSQDSLAFHNINGMRMRTKIQNYQVDNLDCTEEGGCLERGKNTYIQAYSAFRSPTARNPRRADESTQRGI
jgi:hypothetical protein